MPCLLGAGPQPSVWYVCADTERVPLALQVTIGKPKPCHLCGGVYVNMTQHMGDKHMAPGSRFSCPFCTLSFRQRRNLQRHVRLKHPEHFMNFMFPTYPKWTAWTILSISWYYVAYMTLKLGHVHLKYVEYFITWVRHMESDNRVGPGGVLHHFVITAIIPSGGWRGWFSISDVKS